jgi:hypothetical protein
VSSRQFGDYQLLEMNFFIELEKNYPSTKANVSHGFKRQPGQEMFPRCSTEPNLNLSRCDPFNIPYALMSLITLSGEAKA